MLSLADVVRSLTPGILNIGSNTAGPVWAGFLYAWPIWPGFFMFKNGISRISRFTASLARFPVLSTNTTKPPKKRRVEAVQRFIFYSE